MRTFKNRALTTTVVALLTAGAYAPIASAEMSENFSASATIASSYLWRGFELGSGVPVVSADLVYSNSGFYGGLWISSGDGTAGTEYDLFAGYGGTAGDFSYDLSIISYVYPTGQFSSTDGSIGDFMEAIVSVGYGAFSITYKDNIAGETGGYAFNEDYSYLAIGAGFGDFSFTLGMHNEDSAGDSSVTGDATHFDISYAANDNLSFTFSTILDSDFDKFGQSEAESTFVASYSVPF